MATISVVMTTYNGEKYIVEQLDSIRLQTKKPDEVIICDDLSTDNTYEIIRRYICTHSLNNWILMKNERNLGWKRNFYYAISQAKGEIVFLADQDDIWNLNKIEDMVNIIISNPNIEVLVGQSDIFYVENKRIDPPFYSFKNRCFYLDSMWQGKGFFSLVNSFFKKKKTYTKKVSRIIFSLAIAQSQRQGCVMAFQKEFWNKIKIYWDADMPHDSLLWMYGAIYDGLYDYDCPVIQYRHHGSNTGFSDTIGGGITKNTEINKIESKILELEKIYKNIKNDESISGKDNKAMILACIIEINRQRIDLLQCGRILDWHIIKNHKDVVGKRQMYFDYLLSLLT